MKLIDGYSNFKLFYNGQHNMLDFCLTYSNTGQMYYFFFNPGSNDSVSVKVPGNDHSIFGSVEL